MIYEKLRALWVVGTLTSCFDDVSGRKKFFTPGMRRSLQKGKEVGEKRKKTQW